MTQPTDKLKIMTDEHISKVISQQLIQKGVDTVRLIDMLPAGTPDPDVLEYCYQHGTTLLTLDEHMRKHITARQNEGKDHAGVFMGGHHLQGNIGIGTIVNFVVFYREAINIGAATLDDDVYNTVTTIT
ncbi:MAG: DUF5615 family PIN-like protein [Chloroflexota bacterium]